MASETRLLVLGQDQMARDELRRRLVQHYPNISTSPLDPHTIVSQSYSPNRTTIFIILGEHNIDYARACAHAKHKTSNTYLLFVGDRYSLDDVIRIFSQGADGFILKTISSESLINVVNLLALGEKVLPSQIVPDLCALPRYNPRNASDITRMPPHLSSREFEILDCLVAGEANKTISRHLHISEATVKVHVKAILRKLNVSNRTQAAIWAIDVGVARTRSNGNRLSPARTESRVAFFQRPGSAAQSGHSMKDDFVMHKISGGSIA